MRRIALLTGACLTLLVMGGCKSDGRTLREPGPYQTTSISTLPASIDTVGPTDSFDSLDTLVPPENPNLTITAPWPDGGPIDPRYTCDGLNVSPALSWSPAPAGTVEIVITVSDLDAPDFTHWGLAGLSPDTTLLAEGTVPLGAYRDRQRDRSHWLHGSVPSRWHRSHLSLHRALPG